VVPLEFLLLLELEQALLTLLPPLQASVVRAMVPLEFLLLLELAQAPLTLLPHLPVLVAQEAPLLVLEPVAPETSLLPLLSAVLVMLVPHSLLPLALVVQAVAPAAPLASVLAVEVVARQPPAMMLSLPVLPSVAPVKQLLLVAPLLPALLLLVLVVQAAALSAAPPAVTAVTQLLPPMPSPDPLVLVQAARTSRLAHPPLMLLLPSPPRPMFLRASLPALSTAPSPTPSHLVLPL
jgi:hypothetical protein